MQRKLLGPTTVCGPTAPGRGFCFVSALTDFIATAHDLAGSALTLYLVPLCPWNFQPAPLTEPHNLPGIRCRRGGCDRQRRA